MGMMRQYELVDRVRSYNPNTDEDMLNRAYVYAMVAHGEQANLRVRRYGHRDVPYGGVVPAQ